MRPRGALVALIMLFVGVLAKNLGSGIIKEIGQFLGISYFSILVFGFFINPNLIKDIMKEDSENECNKKLDTNEN